MAAFYGDSERRLPLMQRMAQEYRPKLRELGQKYLRVSFHIDDPALSANLPDVINKTGFMVQLQSQSTNTANKPLVSFISESLESGDLFLLQYQPQPGESSLIDLLRELRRKSARTLKIGLIPIFMSAPSSSKQQNLFRLLGQFDIRYAIFLNPGATLENHVEQTLKNLVEYNALLKKNFETSVAPPLSADDSKKTEVVSEYQRLLMLAEELMLSGKYEEAIGLFTTAIELQPDFSSLMQRGDAFYKIHKYILALNDYREANRLKQKAPEPYAKISACCFKLMQEGLEKKDMERGQKMAVLGLKYLTDSVQMIDKMVRENALHPERLPPEPYAPILSALVDSDIRGMGMKESEDMLTQIAIKALERTKGIDAANSDIDVDTRIDRAIILARNGFYDEAETIFRDIIKRDVQDVGPALNNFAIELRKNGQYAKAFEIYLELLRYDIPDRDIVLENFRTAAMTHATSLKNDNRLEEAIHVYRAVLDFIPNPKGKELILMDMAGCYHELNDSPHAFSFVMEAALTNPAFITRDDVKARYRELLTPFKDAMRKIMEMNL